MKKVFLFIVSLLMFNFCFTQCNGRYNTEIFTNVNKITLVYSSVYNLEMDIYQPDGDLEINRPVIIFMHAGSFTGGTRDMADMVTLCESFAKRGYVTASIDYRLNPNQNVVENTSDEIDLLSNGFKFRSSGAHLNGSGRTYIYMAFGQSIVGTNNVCATAR